VSGGPERAHIAAEALRRRIDDLAPQASGREVDRAFDAIVRSAHALFECAGAGIMLVDDENVLHYAASTDERAALLESAQASTGTGPCVDSLVLDTVVDTPDIVADGRWPALAAALDGAGVRAVLGTPVHLGGLTVGSLNVYRMERYAWDASDRTAIEAIAAVVGQVLELAMVADDRSKLAEQLSHALEHRVVIERAVGVLMGRQGIGPVEAFNRLRGHARSRRVRVAEVAAALLAGAPLP
jgi:GAF domain-containing protein